MLLIIISIIIVLLIVAIYAIYGKNNVDIPIPAPQYTPSLPPQNIPAPTPLPPVSTSVYIPPGIPTQPAPIPIPVPIEKPAPTCNGILADEIAYYYYYNPSVKTDAKSHWDLVGYKDPSVKSCWYKPTPAPIIAFSDLSTPVVLPPPPTPIPEPIPIPTPVIIPEPAPTVVAPTCYGDKRAYYSYYNPDVIIDPYTHWMTQGYKEPGRKSCWPSPAISGACDGILRNEAAYYFNLYPELIQKVANLPTQLEKDTWAKNDWYMIGYALGRKSCWPAPVVDSATLTTDICESNWNTRNLITLPTYFPENIKIVSAKFGRYGTAVCYKTGSLCAGMDVTAKIAELCDNKKTCKFPSLPTTFFGRDPCINSAKQIIIQYKKI